MPTSSAAAATATATTTAPAIFSPLQSQVSSGTVAGVVTDVDPTTKTPLENEQHEQTIINFQDYWDVIAPAPKTSVKGQLVKGVFKTMGKQRRISLEVHRIPMPKIPSGLDIESDSDSDEEDDQGVAGEGFFVEKAYMRISKKKNSHKPLKKSRHVVNHGLNDNMNTNTTHSSSNEDDASSIVSSPLGADDGSIFEFPIDSGGDNVMNEHFSTPLAVVDENRTTISEQQERNEFSFNDLHYPTTTASTTPTTLHRNGLSTIIHKEKWRTKYKFEVSNIKITKVEKSKVTLHLKSSNKKALDSYTEERNVYFDSVEEAMDFAQKLDNLQRTDRECRSRNYDKAVRGLDISQEEMDVKIHFLIEIVGAEKLVISDIKSSDPFVVAKFANKEIHRTKYISNNLNPIWTLRQKAFFIFSTTPRDLFTDLHGLNFIVYDYDLGGNDILGCASLPPKTLFKANEERLEMELKPMMIGKKIFPKVSRKDPNIGTLAVRCRRATENDLEFMKKFNNHPKKGTLMHLTQTVKDRHMDKMQNQKGPTLLQTLTTRYKRTERDESGNKVDKFLVRPSPDPLTPTKQWMTSGEIDVEVMKKSRRYKCLGVGGIAKIYLEILSCSDLPNLENIRFGGNKTDAFVQVVYEDCISETCVINDCNNPRWLPWTNRAFELNTKYPSSVIYIGVHDYDAGAKMISDHDMVGRCAVHVSNLKPNTEYVLDYAIHNTSMKVERKKQGSVKIRVRLDIDDPRAHLLASLVIPPPIYVNTKDAKNFHCIRHTINGDYDVSEYSLQTIIMLGKELLSHKQVIHYGKRIIADCFFWRPVTKITVRIPWFLKSAADRIIESDSMFDKWTVEKDIFLPFYSILVLIAWVLVVENPRLLPSFSLFSLGLLLLTTKHFRTSYPNPWWRSTSFTEMCLMLVLGKKATVSPESIDVNESAKEAKEADEYWEKLIEEEEAKGARIRAEIYKEQQALERDLLEARGDADDISTKVTNVNLDPLVFLKPYLYPAQLALIQLCTFIRFVKNVLQWQESHYSFFITLGSFALAVTFIFLPWVFIIHWFARILVWVLAGPWMLLLDPKRKEKLSAEDVNAQDAINRLKRKLDRDKTLIHARIQNENARKYRDFKMYFFGKYLTRVPIFQADRYLDLPLASSSAVPIKKQKLTFGEVAIEESGNKDFEIGQRLVGVMIPHVRETDEGTIAPTGQVAKQKSLIKVGDVSEDIGDDSASLAYVKLGSIAIFAAVVSYISVPLMIQLLQGALSLFDGKQEL